MSLTSHLNKIDSPVRLFMDAYFPNIRPIQVAARPKIVEFTPSTIKPADGLHVAHGTIGMALDYRLRYYFAITDPRHLVAFKGAVRRSQHPNLWAGLWLDCLRLTGNLPEGQKVYEDDDAEYTESMFFVQLGRTLDELKPVGRRLDREDEIKLCRYCVILAYYEEISRMGSDLKSPLSEVAEDTFEHIMAIPADHWLEDLCTLSWSFYDTFAHLLTSEQVNLNPNFSGSVNVGGADADLILDHCLIDIKSTINPRLDKVWLYQLLGYVLLDYQDQNEIRSVAILYARQGFMLKWELNELLAIVCGESTVPTLGELRADFQQMIAVETKRREDVLKNEKALLRKKPRATVSTQKGASDD